MEKTHSATRVINPYRIKRRFTLPVETIFKLDNAAKALRIPTERLVEQIILAELPEALSNAAAEFVKDSIRRAKTYDREHSE
jgi:hypothetical protein